MTTDFVLHIYWDDGVTIECRYFHHYEDAFQYAKDNGIEHYKITKK